MTRWLTPTMRSISPTPQKAAREVIAASRGRSRNRARGNCLRLHRRKISQKELEHALVWTQKAVLSSGALGTNTTVSAGAISRPDRCRTRGRMPALPAQERLAHARAGSLLSHGSPVYQISALPVGNLLSRSLTSFQGRHSITPGRELKGDAAGACRAGPRTGRSLQDPTRKASSK
jgi:hypothetical protein